MDKDLLTFALTGGDGLARKPHGVEPPYAYVDGEPASVWTNEELKAQGRLRQDANPWEAKDLVGR